MPETPKKAMATVRFAEEYKNDPEMPPKKEKSLFCAENRFFASKPFLRKKYEFERKSAKRVKRGSKTPKKALVTVWFTRWG